ncbi:MAG: Transcriptional regulator, LysR family protein [Myxococcaceae bacterium]|nr:Transcriptional regulator, LysR family protein [Myxococcaceae bacterium]
MLSTDNIATFVQVVRRQSLSAAARSMGLPKSTVSRRLVRLEEELHSKLLQRGAHKFSLTAAGRRFYDAVVVAVDALDAAVTALEVSQKEPRGVIRITAPPDLGRMQLAPMFVAFLERYPDISLDVVLTSRSLDLAQEGIDLAVRAGRVLEGTLIARKLCDAELQLASSAELARALATQDLRSLEQAAFVLYRNVGSTQVLKLERGSGKRRRTAELTVSGRINVDDYAALAELVAAGQGVGLMPAVHVQEGVLAGRLTRVFPDWCSKAGHVYLVYPSRQQPERVRLLARFLIDGFKQVRRV